MDGTANDGIYMDSNYQLVYPKGATHLDGIPKDVLDFIHPHWGNFPPQHPLIVNVVGIVRGRRPSKTRRWTGE